MYKALVIGCGNIGALYDLEKPGILTHAKALTFDSRFSLYVYDTNTDLSEKIARKYNAILVREISREVLATFDCVSICTPTNSHFTYLKLAFESSIPLVICEKPVSYSLVEMEHLTSLYSISNTNVLVNYMRRFQPSYKKIKDFIDVISDNQSLISISIRYQRGFLNNCSHAFDTLQYLLDKNFLFKSFDISSFEYDSIFNDPTISFLGNYDGYSLSVVGLPNVKYSFFEIDMFFEKTRILFKNSGNEINVFNAKTNNINLMPLEKNEMSSQINCLHEQMKHVIECAHSILSGKTNKDNFLESIELNTNMINLIKLRNGKISD
jgi:hypothetical protein